MTYNGHMGELIVIDPEIMGGIPVFGGTRVPVKTLFEYLEDNYTLEEFVECFPAVSFKQAKQVLDESQEALIQQKSA